ncbi:MAG TPA: aryl-sulfate sulfotransferase, partial [Panacibacter sp.]|nr:aryl-sulfate sulfotransferase [Panacibacter sp.]
MKLLIKVVLLYLFVLSAGCKGKDIIKPVPEPEPVSIIKLTTITVNPNGTAPLSATIALETTVKCKVYIRVVGKHGPDSDVSFQFEDMNTLHIIPVLGLYASFDNTVELTLKDQAGAVLEKKTVTAKTAALATGLPTVTINTKTTAQMQEGMTFVSYFGYNTGDATPQTPFMFDAFGDIRWYADFSRVTNDLNNLFYDDGMEKLQNGNLYFGDGSTNKIYELDFTGKIINTWDFPGYGFHHNVQEKPNGNFLVTVSKQGSPTVEDHIIEIDRNTKQIIRHWDLNQSLQYSRQTLNDNTVDWIHVNAVLYDESDNTIIISGRTQGLVKLDQNNNVVWISGCHKGWGIAGNGTDLNNFLLQPLDKNNQPITDQSILNGDTNSPDFEWNWYQHAPLIMPNGHIMLFDNGGYNRNFGNAAPYSRAAEFEIDKTNKTIKQIWQYGKERGADTYSGICSDVDFYPANNHVIFSPGVISNNSVAYGKVVEVDYTTKNVI